MQRPLLHKKNYAKMLLKRLFVCLPYSRCIPWNSSLKRALDQKLFLQLAKHSVCATYIKPTENQIPIRMFCSTAHKKTSTLNQSSDITRLLGLAKLKIGYISGAVGLLFVSSSITLAVPYCMGKIIDLIQSVANNETPQNAMQPIVTGLCTLFVVGAAANAGRIYLLESAGQHIRIHLRNKIYKSIMTQDMEFFDKSKTGEIINRLASDVELVSGSVTQNISDGLRSLAQFSAGVGMMLANMILMILPPIAIGAVFYGRFIRQIAKRTQTSLANSTQMANEKISNIRTVQSFGKERLECENYFKKVTTVLNYALKEAKARAVFFGMNGLAGNVFMVLVLYNGGIMMHTGQITVGDLTAFLLYSGYVALSIRGISEFFTVVNKSLGASGRLWELIDMSPSISLQALVGPSGCGKSTITALLMRFYNPDDGVITIGHHDITDINAEWLRNNTGIVPQNPVLFAGTIGENIAYGSLTHIKPSMQQVKQAAHKANLDEFLMGLPKGIETLVGERGVMLSGGQQQRIAIARALLRNPKILLLDEATSALDTESEVLVRDALHKASVGRTTIVIAHRLSTVRRADKIVVFDQNGNIAESGSYIELMTYNNGVFKRLVEEQKVLFA